MLITASSFHHRYTYILVVAGWLRDLYLEIQTLAIWESICLDFLTPQWGKFTTFAATSVLITQFSFKVTLCFPFLTCRNKRETRSYVEITESLGAKWSLSDTISHILSFFFSFVGLFVFFFPIDMICC